MIFAFAHATVIQTLQFLLSGNPSWTICLLQLKPSMVDLAHTKQLLINMA